VKALISIAALLFLEFSLSLPAAPPEPSDSGEKAAIEKVVRASIGWALNKDKALLYDSMNQEEDFFIFHPDAQSTIVGFEAFRTMVENFFMDEKFQATDYAIRDLRIHRSASGDMAWYSCLLDDHGLWNGRKTGWDDARWTGVLEKRAGNWVIAQMHFSLATDARKAESGGSAGIHEAANQGDLIRVKELIGKDPSLINAKDGEGRTPLHQACRGGSYDVIAALVEKGADVNAVDGNLMLPLHYLALLDHRHAAEVLIAHGALVDVQNYEKHSPLHLAATNGCAHIVSLLTEKKAALELRDDYGRTPLLLCARERGGPEAY
jgi:hypothetical protein